MLNLPKLSKKQHQVLKEMYECLQPSSPIRYLILVGAVRSGKSILANIATAYIGTFFSNYINIILGAGLRPIERNIIYPLFNLFGNQYIKFIRSKQELYISGTQFNPFGASDDRVEDKIRGMTAGLALVDEAAGIHENIITTTNQRMSVPGAKLIFTTNPTDPSSWIYQNYIENNNPEAKVWNFTLDDNPSLTEEFKNSIKRSSRGIYYKRAIEGEWAYAEGLVFPEFGASNIINEPLELRDVYYGGIDHGITNPTCFLVISISYHKFPRILVEKEFYFNSSKEGYKKTDNELADIAQDFFNVYNIKSIYIDPKAAGFQLELQRNRRFPCPIMPAKNDVQIGINKLSDLLGSGNLKINGCCRNLIRELRTYAWDPIMSKNGLDAPLKKNDHAIDALRYCIASTDVFFNKHAQNEKEKPFIMPECVRDPSEYKIQPTQNSFSRNPKFF